MFRGDDKYYMPEFNNGKTPRPYRTCYHNYQPFVMPDGKTVYLSAKTDVRVSSVPTDTRASSVHPKPWLGVYLDPAWMLNRVAGLRSQPVLYLGWPDMGTFPINLLYAAVQRTSWYIDQGTEVEIGCIGGHGRTGTFTACLTAYRSPKWHSQDIMDFVWRGYCEKAIETTSQDKLIADFCELVAKRSN